MDEISFWTNQINNKVGKYTDAAGTATLFSFLKQVNDYVDTLEAKLGLNTDGAGTNTVFARLAQISEFVDQVEGYTDTVETTLGTVNTNVSANATKIGTNTDTSGTSTLFARLTQIAAYVDTLETQLGTNTDASSTSTLHGKTQLANERLLAWLGADTDGANPNGTANAKLRDIKNTLATGLSAVKSFQSGVSAVGSTSESIGGQGMSYTDVTITAVNTAKAEVTTRFLYAGASATYPTGYKFVNSTTLRLYTTVANIASVQWEVIEYV